MHAALFYFPGGRLSQPELSSARLDGHLIEVGEGYMPADTVEGVEARAMAVAPLIVSGVAASGPTAAWIHGAGDAPPARHHLHRTTSRRVRVTADLRVVFHDTALGPSDLMQIASVPVTTLRRTMADLVLGAARYPEYRNWALALARVSATAVSEAALTLRERERIPGKRAALALLSELSAGAAGQDDVTR